MSVSAALVLSFLSPIFHVLEFEALLCKGVSVSAASVSPFSRLLIALMLSWFDEDELTPSLIIVCLAVLSAYTFNGSLNFTPFSPLVPLVPAVAVEWISVSDCVGLVFVVSLLWCSPPVVFWWLPSVVRKLSSSSSKLKIFSYWFWGRVLMRNLFMHSFLFCGVNDCVAIAPMMAGWKSMVQAASLVSLLYCGMMAAQVSAAVVVVDVDCVVPGVWCVCERW